MQDKVDVCSKAQTAEHTLCTAIGTSLTRLQELSPSATQPSSSALTWQMSPSSSTSSVPKPVQLNTNSLREVAPERSCFSTTATAASLIQATATAVQCRDRVEAESGSVADACRSSSLILALTEASLHTDTGTLVVPVAAELRTECGH